MSKPRIGILAKMSVGVESDSDPLWSRLKIEDDFRYILTKNGALVTAVLAPINSKELGSHQLSAEEREDLHKLIDECDGLLIQGGIAEDVPYETEAARYAIEQDIPVLGICAGFNVFVKAVGGSLHELADKSHFSYQAGAVHPISIDSDSKLYSMINTTTTDVNSLHTYVATDQEVLPFVAVAHSNDGFVEAIELPGHSFVMGVKWHPELMLEYAPAMEAIFVGLIDAAREKSVHEQR